MPAGVLAHVVARFDVPDSAGAASELPAAQPLTVMDQLPSDTFATSPRSPKLGFPAQTFANYCSLR